MKTALRWFVLSLLIALPLGARAADSTNAVVGPHAADLMALQGDKLAPFKADDFLKARYTILYFSAGWCPDCRVFAPSLVKAYDAQPKGAPRFEVLLVTEDKTEKDMVKYMTEEKMKWPALAFDKIAGAADLEKFYSGHGIPCLTVIDQKGAVVMQSASDQDALDLLKKLQDLLATKS